MSMHSGWTHSITMLIALAVLSACGLTTSDEDRIAKATQAMEVGAYQSAMIELKNVLAASPENVEARLLLAEVSLGLGDIASAEKELTRASELNGPAASIVRIHLDMLLKQRRFSDALAMLGSGATELSADERRRIRGKALLGMGSFDAAREEYRVWLEDDATSTDAKLGLASVDLATGNALESARQVIRITAAEPQNDRAWQLLGAARLRSGDYAGAEAALRKATEWMQAESDIQRFATILASLVESQLAQGNVQDAKATLSQIERFAANAPATLIIAARVARADNDYSLATRYLQQYLNIIPDDDRARIFLANMHLMRGNLTQAEFLLQKVIVSSPDNLQARMMLARVQLRESQPGGAIDALAPVLESNRSDPDLLTLLAQASLMEGDVSTAIRQLREAVEAAPDKVEVKLNLAVAYLNAQQVDMALEVLQQVPEGASTNFRWEKLMLSALLAADRQSEAGAIANRLLTANAGDESAAIAVADYQLLAGRPEAAVTTLQRVVQKAEKSVAARSLLARIEMALGRHEVAAKIYSESLELAPTHLPSLIGLARLAQVNGDDAELFRLLQVAVEAHPDAIGPKVLLAGKLLSSGDSIKAEQIANDIVSLGIENSYVGEIVASIFSEVGRTDDALYEFRRAAALNPNSPTIQVGLARTYLSVGQSVEAKEALTEALKLAPGQQTAMMLLILVEIRQGQLQEAKTHVQKYRALYSADPTGMILEGEVHLQLREFALAAAAFGEAVRHGAGQEALLLQYRANVDGGVRNPHTVLERWLAENANDTVVRVALAQYYQVTRNSERAVEEYTAVLRLTPDDIGVLNNLAWQYQQDGQLQLAAELAERAFELAPDSGSIADTLAWIYRDLGQSQRSEELLSQASNLAPNNGEILYHYAVVLSENGDKVKARDLLESLRDRNARFPSRAKADSLLKDL